MTYETFPAPDFKEKKMSSGSEESGDESLKGKKGMRWRAIALALVIIFLVCALVVLAVVFLTPKGSKSSSQKFSGSVINISEILHSSFSGTNSDAKWINQNQFMYRNEFNASLMLSTISGTNVTTEKVTTHTPGQVWIPSPDGQYIAFGLKRVKLYRHSGFVQQISVVDTTNQTEPVTIGPFQNGTDGIRVFRWNPVVGKNDFVYVSGRMSSEGPANLYYQSSLFKKPVAITKNVQKYFYNGVPDWLYEEEILSTETALWWSNDGNYILYAQFDDSKVDLMHIPLYKSIDGNDTESFYPQIENIPYSKAGAVIPTVNVFVYSTKDNKNVKIKLTDEVLNWKEYYLFNVNWPPDDSSTVIITWANRIQNHTLITSCSTKNGACTKIFEQLYEMNGMMLWAMPDHYNVKFGNPSSEMFAMLPQPGSDGNVYTGVSLFTKSSGPVPLQNGNFDVTSIDGFNKKTNKVYFTAAAPLPRQKHLYMVSANSTNATAAECITCETGCDSVSVSFSSDGESYIYTCNGPNRRVQYLRQISSGNDILLVINNNTKLGEFLLNKALPVIEYTNFTINGYEVPIKVQMPPGTNMQTTGDKFPMIMKVYGGPGSQIVTSSFGVGFDQYLVSNRRYVEVSFDVRGSGNRGWKYQSPIRLKLGTFEIEDQIAAAKKFAITHSFIDSSKVGVWGWSYGGFFTSHTMVADTSKFFKCAAAVAPVTDFRYYDAAYTERYMTTPQMNPTGYEGTNVNKNGRSFNGTGFLLAHGTGDDNVHYQNSMMLVNSLVRHNVQFTFMAYPNQQHSISADRSHLYDLIDTHFVNCFNSKSKEKIEL